MRKLLICTDLDRTLLPNGEQPESPMARKIFSQLMSNNKVCLVYVTGRHKRLVQKAIRCYAIPNPDFVISDVGTRIYDLHKADWVHWQAWESEISVDWAGLSHSDLRDRFRDMRSLRLQERDKQNIYKLSYYVSLDEDSDAIMEEMQSRLKKDGIKASLIWSIDEPAAVGLLDVLPSSATKVHAIQFLRERLGFLLGETVFAGDSGNDLPVFTSPIRSILVANASTSVRQQALAGTESLGLTDTLYIARGDFLGMNGNYSAGILEGIAHYEKKMGAQIAELAETVDA